DLKEVTPATEPGTTYAYSNVGAELIGFVLESVYGMKIDELLQEAFLDEAGMTQTSIAWTDEQQEYGTQGYWLDNTTPSPHLANTLWGTAGGVKMNMADMLRYMAWQLNGENLVAAESHRMLYDSGGSVKVAYFWRMQQDKYGTSYNHHGGTTGMQNWLFLFPDHNLGISIMTNQSGLKTPKFLAQTVQKILKDIVKV
ncbi:MAG: serine hydrolase domain-containing protein, partial [Bacteroidota bacterium]